MTKRSNIAGFSFLAPSFLGFAAFTLLPVAGAIALSFFRWDLFHAPRFVGVDNFRRLLGGGASEGQWQWNDPQFWKYLGNTLFFMMAIPVSMGASLLMAVVLNQKLRGRMIFRAIFFLPTICFGVGILLLWKFLFNPDFGLINRSLQLLGVEGPGWLQSDVWAKPAIMLMGLWATAGGTNMILYLAGLQNISPELYEAAAIDGAGRWHKFLHITIPSLRPTTFFIFTTCLIAGFQGEFDSAYVMTQGGPDGSTTTLGYYIYKHAFEWFNMGYAAAVALVLFGMILVVTLINWRLAGDGGRHV